MRALIISDTHSYLNNAERVIKKHSDINTVIHLGDLVDDAEKLKKKYSNKDFHYVRGNNDFTDKVTYEKMITFAGKKVLLTHGHRQQVSVNLLSISLWGREQGADVVLFGHTHRPALEESVGIMLFNPGSITLPRSTKSPTYGILEVSEGGVVRCTTYQYTLS